MSFKLNCDEHSFYILYNVIIKWFSVMKSISKLCQHSVTRHINPSVSPIWIKYEHCNGFHFHTTCSNQPSCFSSGSICSIEYSQWTWNGSCRDQWTAPPQRSSWDQRQSTPARSDTASPYCCALSPACHIAPVQPCWSCEGLLSRSTSHLSHILWSLKCWEKTIPLFDSNISISRG